MYTTPQNRWLSIQAPPSPPPSAVPAYCKYLSGSGPYLIEQYLQYYTYIWMRTGESFWMYPFMIKEDLLYGFAWDAVQWVPVMLSIPYIDSLY